MNQGIILIVGEAFDSLTTKLKTNGHSYIILRDQDAANLAAKNPKPYILCDFTNRQQVLATVDTVDQPISAVICLYENYVLATAWINEHLGLPGMNETAALACTDKFHMRQAFAKAPEAISPDFAIIHNEADVIAFADTHSFPLILKPANLVKSLLVTKSDDLDELLANYRQTTGAINSIYQRYAPNRQPTVLVEEFLEGSMHSVAAFVDQQGSTHLIDEIVDLTPARDAGFQDNFLYARNLPSRLDHQQQQSLLHCARLGIAALDMKGSPAHVEIILTPKGPRIIEIGARNGGYRERMYGLANDIDVIQATIDIAVGTTPQLASRQSKACAVLELFPTQPGRFQAVVNDDVIRNLATYHYYRIKVQPREQVGRAADGYKCCAVVILLSEDQAALDADIAYIRDHVYVQTATEPPEHA